MRKWILLSPALKYSKFSNSKKIISQKLIMISLKSASSKLPSQETRYSDSFPLSRDDKNAGGVPNKTL